jgi:hypothetical protein
MPTLKNPTNKELDHWHQVYIDHLVALYEKYKHLNNNVPLEIW